MVISMMENEEIIKQMASAFSIVLMEQNIKEIEGIIFSMDLVLSFGMMPVSMKGSIKREGNMG